MSRDILPIFDDGKTPEPAMRAMSEPFLRPDAFTVGLEHRSPDWKPEELIGLRTLYMAPREPIGVPAETCVVVDPTNRFEEQFDAAKTVFIMGHLQQLLPFKKALYHIVEGGMSEETLGDLSSHVLEIASRGSLKTVVAVAVTGSLESPVAKLVVPRKIGNELGVYLRDRMISDPSSVEVAEETRPKIMTQHQMIQDLGVVVAANLLPFNL